MKGKERMFRMRRGLVVWGLTSFLGLVLAGPSWGWTLEEAAKPYRGATLKVGVAFVPVVGGIFPLIKNDFTPRTGIKVKVEKFTHSEWDAKGDADLYSRTGYFDLVMMHHNRAEDWAGNGHVEWINKYMNDPKLRDPDLDPDDFLQPLWDDYCLFNGGKRACLPTFNYQMVYWFRKDLMNDSGERAAFKKRYGYDLGPARTFKQYRDIAEFLTRKKGEKLAGKVLKTNFYGVGVVGKREASLSWEWFNILKGWGASVFDKEGRPTFTTKAIADATHWWLGLRKFAPPGVTEAGFIDLFVLMTKRNIAQAIQWSVSFAFVFDDPKFSKADGEYSFAPLPSRKADMPPGGFGEAEPLVISKYSKNPAASYLFMQWLASKRIQKKWIEGPGHGLLVRKSSLEIPFVKGHPVYGPALISMKHGWIDPGFSNYIQLREEITIQITEAAAGRQTVEQGLEKIQARALKLHQKGNVNPGQPPHTNSFVGR